MFFANLIFAALPILLIIFSMTKKSPMPSARALPLAAMVAYGSRARMSRRCHKDVGAGWLLGDSCICRRKLVTAHNRFRLRE